MADLLVQDFAIKSLKGGVVTDATTKEFVGEIEYGDGITISNTSDKVELKSGEGMSTLYSMSTNFASLLSGDFVMSTDLFKILTGGDEIQQATQTMLLRKTYNAKNGFDVTTGALTLDATPKAGGRMYVFGIDENGLRTQLTVGDPTANAKEYSITGTAVAVNPADGFIAVKVIADFEKEGLAFNKQAKSTKAYCYEFECAFINLKAKSEHIGVFRIPYGSISTNFDISASNAEFTKATIEVDCQLDTVEEINWQLLVATE